MPTDTAPRLVIVSGVSGSGRASALRVLEDLGFYCVDNLPVALAPEVERLVASSDPAPAGVALGIDPRERLFFPQWPQIFSELERSGIQPQILYLDASDEVLARRYSETRRPHPMADTGSTVAESIRRERQALAEMRERASRVIDTSTLTVHELREIVTAWIRGATSGSEMNVAVESFGYKYGTPVGMDIVLDARFLANPNFVPELKPLTGADDRVRDYVMSQTDAQSFVERVADMLGFLIPLYRREGKSYLTIGVGCTGGRHRSPVLARAIAERLRARGLAVHVRDHHIAM